MNRCQCLKADGKQCSRDAKTGSQFCWQHQNCKKQLTGAIKVQGTKKSQGTKKASIQKKKSPRMKKLPLIYPALVKNGPEIKLKPLSEVKAHEGSTKTLLDEINQIFGQQTGRIYTMVGDGMGFLYVRRSSPDEEPETYFSYDDQYPTAQYGPPYAVVHWFIKGYKNVGSFTPP